MLDSQLRRLSAFRSLLLLAALLCPPAAAGVLVPDDLARRNGMQRAWFSQVQLNPARNTVVRVTLNDGLLVAVTSAGVVHAMDAETGQTLWVQRLGNPAHPSLGPAIDDVHVAVINGSTVFVLDRADGREVFHRQVGGGVGGGPALVNHCAKLSNDKDATAELCRSRVFVPHFSGQVEGFAVGGVDDSETDAQTRARIPWEYRSDGRIFDRVVAAGPTIVWTTDRSHLFVAGFDVLNDRVRVRYRFDTGAPIVAPAAIRPPLVYAGSLAGYVFALDEESGQQMWRYAAGFPIRRSPLEVGGTLYVATDEPALHAIDSKTGQPKWIAEGVAQFIAASPSRVYGVDRLGGLVGLDSASGVAQGRAANRGLNTAVLNDQTDRLYLFSDDGLIQCLHEIGADEPHYHRPKADKPKKPTEGDATDAEEPSADEPDPFGGDQPADDPFGGNDAGGGGDDPFGGSDDGAGDDPFGGGGDDPFGGGGDDPFGDAGDDPFG